MNDVVIDSTTFLELQDAAGADFVDELLGTFFEEAPTLLSELRSAQAAGDTARWRRAAHTLKTNALTFGAMALGEQARALELSALPDGAAALEALDTLDAAYATAAAALEGLRHG
jgi:HPt (histidine-containing phosphotransfer) domain-containing protein